MYGLSLIAPGLLHAERSSPYGSDCFLVWFLKEPFARSGAISDGVIASTRNERRVPAVLFFFKLLLWLSSNSHYKAIRFNFFVP